MDFYPNPVIAYRAVCYPVDRVERWETPGGKKDIKDAFELLL